ELEPAEELAIARGALGPDLGLDAYRTQQDRLCQGDVVAIDQPLRRHVLELEQPVLISQVGEEGLQQGFRRELELQGYGREHLVAAKGWSGCQADLGILRRPSGPQPPAGRGGRGEHLLANLLGRHIGDNLELGPILQHLGDPTVHERCLTSASKHMVDLFLDLAASHSHALTEDRQQALGRLQPLRAVAVEVQRDDPLFREPDADEITGEHRRSDRNRTARFGSPASNALRRTPASGAVTQASFHYSVARSPLVRRHAHFPRLGSSKMKKPVPEGPAQTMASPQAVAAFRVQASWGEKGDSHQMWRTQRVQVNVVSLRLFL